MNSILSVPDALELSDATVSAICRRWLSLLTDRACLAAPLCYHSRTGSQQVSPPSTNTSPDAAAGPTFGTFCPARPPASGSTGPNNNREDGNKTSN